FSTHRRWRAAWPLALPPVTSRIWPGGQEPSSTRTRLPSASRPSGSMAWMAALGSAGKGGGGRGGRGGRAARRGGRGRGGGGRRGRPGVRPASVVEPGDGGRRDLQKLLGLPAGEEAGRGIAAALLPGRDHVAGVRPEHAVGAVGAVTQRRQRDLHMLAVEHA